MSSLDPDRFNEDYDPDQYPDDRPTRAEADRDAEDRDAEECIHGLNPTWCSVCLHGISRSEPETVEYYFSAKRDGQCPGCDLPVRVGDRIAKMSTGRYLHDYCGDDEVITL